MKYLVHVKGYKFHYGAEALNIAEVKWCNEEVIELNNPKEIYETDLYSDPEDCGIVGSVFIPKSQISHIIIFTDTIVHNSLQSETDDV